MRKQGLTPPRLGTPRSKAPSLGPIAANVAAGLGVEWWPWQKYVSDASLELRRQRGRELMRLQARQVGVMVSRQNGKSILSRVRAWTQCLLPELDGVADLVGGRVGAQRVGWLCQDRANAIRAWVEAVDMLMASPYAEAVERVRMQRGDEHVKFRNGSLLRVVTPSRTGPRGLDLDLVMLDEALAHEVALLAALAPTQAARDSNLAGLGAQLVALSSEGDERSTLLATMAEVGRRAVLDGDRTRMWFEWAAEPLDDPYDPEVWKRAIPTLDRPGGVSSDFIALQAETMDVDDFRREYLCLHTPRPAAQVISPERWEAAPVTVPGTAILFAVDGTPTGSAASIIAISLDDDDIFAVEIVEAHGGVEWVARSIVEKAQRWSAPVVLDATGPMAWLTPTLEQANVEVVRLRASDVIASASRFAVLVDEGRVGHQPDSRFDAAIAAAKRRRSGQRWGFDRAAGDISTIVAAALGVWAAETTEVLQAQVW